MAVHRSQAGPLLQCRARWESKDAKELLLGSGVLLVCVNHVVDWKSIFIQLIEEGRHMLYCSNTLAHGYCSHFSSSTPRIWHLRYSSNFSPLPSEKSVFPPVPHLGKPLRKKNNPLPKTKTKASSVAQSVSDSLQPHGLQHARPPCPSPTPRAYSNSCPLSR